MFFLLLTLNKLMLAGYPVGNAILHRLKSDSHLPKKFCIICLIESPLKMMKNAFFSPENLFSFSGCLRFCHDLVMQEKRLN